MRKVSIRRSSKHSAHNSRCFSLSVTSEISFGALQCVRSLFTQAFKPQKQLCKGAKRDITIRHELLPYRNFNNGALPKLHSKIHRYNMSLKDAYAGHQLSCIGISNAVPKPNWRQGTVVGSNTWLSYGWLRVQLELSLASFHILACSRYLLVVYYFSSLGRIPTYFGLEII